MTKAAFPVSPEGRAADPERSEGVSWSFDSRVRETGSNIKELPARAYPPRPNLGVCNPLVCLLLTKECRNRLEQLGLADEQTLFDEIHVRGSSLSCWNARRQSSVCSKYQ
jgi:hypothetical protein